METAPVSFQSFSISLVAAHLYVYMSTWGGASPEVAISACAAAESRHVGRQQRAQHRLLCMCSLGVARKSNSHLRMAVSGTHGGSAPRQQQAQQRLMCPYRLLGER